MVEPAQGEPVAEAAGMMIQGVTPAAELEGLVSPSVALQAVAGGAEALLE
jgi:hypothetical protein